MRGSVRVIFVLVSSLFALEVQAQPVVEWTKTLQGNGAWSVQQTLDNGYFLVGERFHTLGSGHMDMHLIRTNENGDTLWTCSIGGVTPTVYAGGRSGTECFDGSFVAVGYYGLDVYVVKTSSGGVPLWTKTFRGFIPGYKNWSSCVQETTDHGYIVSGYSDVFGWGDNALVLKLDQNGNQGFLDLYGDSQYEQACAIIQTPDTGYIAVGSRRPMSTVDWYDQFWILKINATGSQEWAKVYGGLSVDVATGVCRTGDGGYLVAGYTSSYGAGDYDFYLMKVNSSGDSVWARTYGSPQSERCYSMTQTGYDSFVLAGSGNGKMLAVNVNANGDPLWTKEIPGNAGVVAEGYAVDATEDGGCIIAGSAGTLTAYTYLVKLTLDVTAVDDRSGLPARYELYQNVPNPFNPTTLIRYDVPPGGARVTLRVFDVSGKVVKTLADGVESAGQKSAQWDGRNESGNQVSTGVYFCRLTAGSFVETKKMVLLK